MGFADKKGITIASGFKLQAAELLDARGQVESIAERDELVTLNAVTEGLRVYVKENKTAYTWNGTGWDEEAKGNLSQDLTGYVKKEDGKGLSSNDFTDEEKEKLAGLENTTVKAELDKKVPTSRKVNGKSLTEDISLEAEDVSAVPASQKGAAGGVAELGEDGKVPAAQLPSYVDDVIEGYLSGGKFYEEVAHTTEIAGETGKIYVDLADGKTYRWSGTAFVEISASLALGETSSTAYRGDRGKTAYDHSQSAHAPANAQANVQGDWEETDVASDAYIKNKPDSLPADGGNADTVGGHTVAADVPANAVFTDTTYGKATQATDGLMSKEDKAKVDNMPTVTFGTEYPTSAPTGSIHFLVEG